MGDAFSVSFILSWFKQYQEISKGLGIRSVEFLIPFIYNTDRFVL